MIVPSLPGYTFSSGPPLDKNFSTEDISRILDRLMKDIGFESGYVAQGGDIGSRVARALAVDYGSCKGMHGSVPLLLVASDTDFISAVHREFYILL